MPLLFVVLFACLSARADEWKTSYGAELESEGLYETSGKVGPDDKIFRGIYTARLPTTIRHGEYRLRLNPYGQFDPNNISPRERVYLDAPEAYLQWQGLPWTVQAGLNVFNWGDTDVFNPLDVVNPRRYFDPLRSEKVGTPALTIKREFENFFVEGIYIPYQRRTLVPGENSRWLPRDVYRVRSFPVNASDISDARLILPDNLNYTYAEPGAVSGALRNNFGFRAKFRLPNFDWTIAAFQGSSVTPDVRPLRVGVRTISYGGSGTATVQLKPDVVLQSTAYPIRMTGTSFTWVLGDYLVKGAVAYTAVLDQRYDLPVRLWENVLAVERSFSVGSGTLTALAQTTYVVRGDALDTNSISLARMFESAVMGALRWAPSEDWTILASYLRDLKFGGGFLRAEASYKLTDGWRVKLSGDALDGPTETPLGTYRRNDRMVASLAATF